LGDHGEHLDPGDQDLLERAWVRIAKLVEAGEPVVELRDLAQKPR